ncbi:MAG: hypothetical protein J5989_00610 [Alistipes sp.]|nr:hypothetical protein [Alistipes sp.]
MKRFIIMLLTIVAFAGCSKEDNSSSVKDEITRGITQIDVPLADVLKEDESWLEYRTFIYTEPNGEGEETCIWDYEAYVEAPDTPEDRTPELLDIKTGQILKYVYHTQNVMLEHYYVFEVVAVEDDVIRIVKDGEEYYIKILAYDHDYLWIETNCYDKDSNYQYTFGRADSFPYVRILYKRHIDYGKRARLSERLIIDDVLDLPIELPDNILELAGASEVWKVTYMPMCEVEDDKLVVRRTLHGFFFDWADKVWHTFIDGKYYRIEYRTAEHNNGKEIIKIVTYNSPKDYIVAYTDNNELLITEFNHKIAVENKERNYCMICDPASEEVIEQIKKLYEDPNVEKIYSSID